VAPTEMQTLILWALLAKPGGASFQKDLIPEVKKPDRDALVGAGLITAVKQARLLRLEVTEKGWAWAAEHLDADLPKRSTAGCAVLQAWLTQLNLFMKGRHFALADFFNQQPPAEAAAPPPLDDATLPDRIRMVYLELTGGRFNTRALLRDIRDKLRDVGRGKLDEALTRMQRDQVASLYQLDNRIEITDADRAAAIYFGSEPRHILWIER
jgi:hypothetical protein